MKTYLTALAFSACLLTLAACEKSPKDETTTSEVDTSDAAGDTSTTAAPDKETAESLAASGAANAARQAYGSKLKSLAMTINRACPVSFTPTIYLDSTRVLGPGEMLFNMHLRNYTAGESDIEPKKEEVRKSLMQSVTADKQPIVTELHKNGVAITFRYRDRSGQPIFDIPLKGEK